MQLSRVCVLLICSLITLDFVTSAPSPQEPAFELPVQLVGFPVIIAAVRITNFIKKLAYSLNPQTYMSRMKRAGIRNPEEIILDVEQVEKRLISEMGESVCIYEHICSKYAEISLMNQSQSSYQDLDEIFRQYKTPTDTMKENYLLSVFLGEIVRSPTLCHQLAKRGRACDETTLSD
ncbi:hypothetical protein HCN44_010061 [Aphidius gifuensis]|uniref:Odorant-binding protein n=1 Tax=Aphidius gifuensis TaxID=684658 RepID=A0A834XZ10_APHGI|nr:uncharacterized protein LOC122851634 [Aphidius gifuensis]XP_044006929.1 uncharacterized protein LOC122851634 [Aphidius gifuensis]KAF7993466.1 hypothetical protein HCN44_010061 [Aphidius gifuensis]